MPSARRRAYFKNSYFQLTDDSIAGGGIIVFDHCTFDFYGSHPSGGGSSTITAFLNSTFNFYNDSPVFWFSKSGGTWTIIDNVFRGPKEEIRWENTQRPDVKHYVYGNVYEDGTPVVFDLVNTQVTTPLTADALRIFKIGAEYNVFNLLKGSDGWNPSQQVARNETAFKFTMAANNANIASDNPANETIITPTLVPANFFNLRCTRLRIRRFAVHAAPERGRRPAAPASQPELDRRDHQVDRQGNRAERPGGSGDAEHPSADGCCSGRRGYSFDPDRPEHGCAAARL